MTYGSWVMLRPIDDVWVMGHVVVHYSVMGRPMDERLVISVMVKPMDGKWVIGHVHWVVVAYNVKVRPMNDIWVMGHVHWVIFIVFCVL